MKIEGINKIGSDDSVSSVKKVIKVEKELPKKPNEEGNLKKGQTTKKKEEDVFKKMLGIAMNDLEKGE